MHDFYVPFVSFFPTLNIICPQSLRLTNKARGQSTTGQLMNLISSDAQHFVMLMPFLHVIWSGPFQIVVAVVLLWNELGPSVFAGVAVLLLLLPLSAITARISKSFQVKKLSLDNYILRFHLPVNAFLKISVER